MAAAKKKHIRRKGANERIRSWYSKAHDAPLRISNNDKDEAEAGAGAGEGNEEASLHTCRRDTQVQDLNASRAK
jgi:hypothetical protein